MREKADRITELLLAKVFKPPLIGARTSPKSEQDPLCLQGFRSYLVWKGVLNRKTPDKPYLSGVFGSIKYR